MKLMLDHTFVAPHSGIQKNAGTFHYSTNHLNIIENSHLMNWTTAQLEGVLFDQYGKEMHPPPPNQIGISFFLSFSLLHSPKYYVRRMLICLY
jgi:hypothetical protein